MKPEKAPKMCLGCKQVFVDATLVGTTCIIIVHIFLALSRIELRNKAFETETMR